MATSACAVHAVRQLERVTKSTFRCKKNVDNAEYDPNDHRQFKNQIPKILSFKLLATVRSFLFQYNPVVMYMF